MNQNILYEYTIKETIGKGTFSKVKLGINKSTGEKVAIKILEKRKIKTKTDKIRVERELNILKKINHINIVKILQTKEDQDNIYIIMEFINYDLFLHIVNNKRLDEKESSFYFYQLISGLEYIHSLNIVHRDLKPENLLITKKRILKIIDFGLSNYFINDELLFTPCGSPSYTPPEMIKGYKYNGYAVDIWSSGIILYGMLCGYLPFEERDNKALFKKIVKCKVVYPKTLSNNAQNLLKKILVPNPDKRININEIKKHPFYLEGKEIFYKRYPDLIGMIENKKKIIPNNIKLNNNNNSTPPNNYMYNNKNNIQIAKFSISGKKEKDYDDFKKENDNSSSFLSKSIKTKRMGPNFDLLKKILRGSRINSSEKKVNIFINTEIKTETENKMSIEEEYKEIDKENEDNTNCSPVRLIRKINKEKESYKNRSQKTANRDKRHFYRQKFLNSNMDTNDFEEEKNFLKSSYNNYSNYANSDILKRKESKDNPYEINSINNNDKSYNYSQKYTFKRNNNHDLSFIKNSKKVFHRGKINNLNNDIVNDEKIFNTLNHNFQSNNYSYKIKKNIKVHHKNNNSINYNNQSPAIYFDSFHYNSNNKSTRIKSYLTKNSKNDRYKKSEKNNQNPINLKNEKNIDVPHLPPSPKYSGLSKKIISINNLYNSIQNKLDNYRDSQERRNKFDINIEDKNIIKSQSSLENVKNAKTNININTSTKNNKNMIKSENHRKKKNKKYVKNINNIKFSPSYMKKHLKSLKNSNNNSDINIRNLKNDSSKKVYIDITNNNNKSMSQKFKKIKNVVKKDVNKKRKINHKDKYNIKDIIKRRGLDKMANK